MCTKVVNVQQPTCERLREYLDSLMSSKLFMAIGRDVLKHVENCKECSRLLRVRVHVKSLLRSRLL